MKLFSGPIFTTISVVFLAAEISYIRFFTTVQKYEFHISKIIILRDSFTPTWLTWRTQSIVMVLFHKQDKIIASDSYEL